MNISYNWLKDLIEIDLSPEELANRLTGVGLAVEGIEAHCDDFVFDVDLTSNRPDCLSHLGVAREIGVIARKEITPETLRRGEEPEIPIPAILAADIVRIVDAHLCHRFTARIIHNVKIGPSPQWLVDRLEAIGERSINNVADITNYAMHELGQPMHAFDLDKLSGNRIVVRRARNGEDITTLDEIDRKLDETMLAICDAEKPVAIAGVMGGLVSSITDKTVNVLLEVAYFKRENIRATSRKLNLTSEASYRFERGVDIENLIRASNRATQLICEIASGEKGEFIDIYPTPFKPNRVESDDISLAVKKLTGLDVETNECLRILTALGIKPDGARAENTTSKSQSFFAPTWRYDIAIEEDLVEEIARHAGYENIANELPPAYGAGEYQPTEQRKKLLRQTLVDLGFNEAISYSFIDTRHDAVFETVPEIAVVHTDEKYVTLRDSVIDGAVRMRPSIIPGLLDAVKVNLNHQRRDLRLFEIGKCFAMPAKDGDAPNEKEVFALILTGGEINAKRAMIGRELDFFDAKGALEASLDVIGVEDLGFADEDVRHLRKGQSASVSHDGQVIGYIGRLSDEIAAAYKFKQPVYLAEVNLQHLLASPITIAAYTQLPRFPEVIRDVSLLTKRSMTYGSVRAAIVSQNVELCRSVNFVDVYEGKGVADDERSLTIRLTYRSDDRTLVETDVEALHKGVITNLEQKLNIKQRF